MRNFLSYLHRRGIVAKDDCLQWALNNKLSTVKDVESFCASRGLSIKDEVAFREMFLFLFEEKSSPSSHKPLSAAKQDLAENKSKSWHVPAAERPLGKARSPAVKKPQRKKRTRKTLPAKDEK